MDYVDENDTVLGQALKKEIYERRLTHRIAHVWIFTTDGKLVIQKRAASCHYCPLHWSVSAAGHVDAGETYEQGAMRELKEELGVALPLIFIDKIFYEDDPRGAKKFIAIFKTTSDGPFEMDPEEVAEVRTETLDEVRQMIARGEPFHPQMRYVLEHYF